jgi:hypothetical protein
MTRRASRSDPWEDPVNLGLVVNTPAVEEHARLSADGSTLYWDSSRPGGYGGHDIWQVSIVSLGKLDGSTICGWLSTTLYRIDERNKINRSVWPFDMGMKGGAGNYGRQLHLRLDLSRHT